VAAAAQAFGIAPSESLAQAVVTLMHELGSPTTVHAPHYAAKDQARLAEAAHRSHFNLHAPFKPTAANYSQMQAISLDLPEQ
jgi:4-hydroxybutyrate dehydrogenase